MLLHRHHHHVLFMAITKFTVGKTFLALRKPTGSVQPSHSLLTPRLLLLSKFIVFFSYLCWLVWVRSSVAAPSSRHICSDAVRNYHNKQTDRTGRTRAAVELAGVRCLFGLVLIAKIKWILDTHQNKTKQKVRLYFTSGCFQQGKFFQSGTTGCMCLCWRRRPHINVK